MMAAGCFMLVINGDSETMPQHSRLPLYFSTLSPVKSEGGGLQRSNSPERHFRIDEIQSLRELLHSDKKAFKLLGRTLVPLFAAYALPNSMSMDFDGFAR